MTSLQLTSHRGAASPRRHAAPAMRAFAMLAVALLAALLSAPPAAQAAQENLRKYAGIVVDAKSGKVLYEKAADERRYPASVTKVMTLYVLFQELSAGNIKLSDKMTVSKYAASAVPTKLGLKAGSKIKVEDAIKALVTLSANDMARVIAEHIAGSESKFAERMTATARGLGMRKTTYKNASGLPNAAQITTARDQAILGAAIYEHFPKYYKYFQTKSFSYGKRTYGNHNRLLGSNGIDGIKTGYINASGYNLLTAMRGDNKHLVIVSFGNNKASERDANVRSLVAKYASKARSGGYLDVAMIPQPGRKGAVVQIAAADEDEADEAAPVPAAPSESFAVAVVDFVEPRPYPAFRVSQSVFATISPNLVAPVPAAAAERGMPVVVEQQAALRAVDEAAPLPRPKGQPAVLDAFASENPSRGAPPAPLGMTAPSAPLVPPVGIGENGREVDPLTSGSISDPPTTLPQAPPPALPAARSGDAWVVQIGAAPTETGASSLISDAASAVGGLGDFRSYVERFEKNGKVFYRARFTGFGGRDDATAMCGQLKKKNMSCLALKG